MRSHPAFVTDRYADAVLASGPLRYYRCNETVGTTLRDLVGTANMTVTGTPTKMGAPGAPGIKDGFGFQTTDGSGGYASAAAAALPTSAYTLAAWTFGGTVSDRGIFGQWTSTGGSAGALLYRSTSSVIGFIHQGTNITSSGSVDNLWHFVVGTWDGSNIRLYVDGALRGGPSAVGTAAASAGGWSIGTYFVSGSGSSRITTGITSECVLWSRALSLGEIAHFNALGRT